MNNDDTYTSRALLRAGQWDLALAALPDGADLLRAEILADRFWWRGVGADETESAAGALGPVDAGYIRALLSYARIVLGRAPRADDRQRALDGFTANDTGWGAFWLGVYSDNVLDDAEAAATHYARAAALADGDPLLESYVVRHQGGRLLDTDRHADGLALLRRSLALRAQLGARAPYAGAAALLGRVLPAGDPEAELWTASAEAVARELGLIDLL